MIPISTRYTTLLIGLLLPVVVLLQSYWVVPVDDCVLPWALSDANRIAGSQGSVQVEENVRGAILQWTEGEVPTEAEHVGPLKFRILRSSNPKQLYRAPANFLVEKIQNSRTELQRVVAGDVELPVHVVYGNTDVEIQMGFYLFVLDGRPVETPFLAELLGAPGQLIRGRVPLTLFSISGAAAAPFFVATDEQAKQWLVSAFEYYGEVCSL
jgi:hypothetical protein